MWSAIRNWFVTFLLKLAFRLGTAHGRRIMYLVSIYYMLVRSGVFPRQELTILNKQLNLAKDTDSFIFPLRIAKWIWRDICIPELVVRVTDVTKADDSVKDVIIDNILAATPKWMKYGSDVEMARDIIALIKSA